MEELGDHRSPENNQKKKTKKKPGRCELVKIVDISEKQNGRAHAHGSGRK